MSMWLVLRKVPADAIAIVKADPAIIEALFDEEQVPSVPASAVREGKGLVGIID